MNDDKFLPENLARYIRGLSSDAYRVMEAYNLDDKIARLDRAGLLYAVVADFADLDVRPSMVSNEAMGYIFEELLRKFSEMSNETAGEHYTPREVIQLMVDLLLTGKASEELTQNPIPVRTLYDPAAGTGGSQHNHRARHIARSLLETGGFRPQLHPLCESPQGLVVSAGLESGVGCELMVFACGTSCQVRQSRTGLRGATFAPTASMLSPPQGESTGPDCPTPRSATRRHEARRS